MSNKQEQLKKAYMALPEEVQDFIMYSETTNFISEKLKEAGVPKEKASDVDSQIWEAMLGLQTMEKAIGKISDLTKINQKELSLLKSVLQDNIFFKINSIVALKKGGASDDSITFNSSGLTSPAPNQNESSFPMIEEGEVAHDVPPSTTSPSAQPVTPVPGSSPAQEPSASFPIAESKEQPAQAPEAPKTPPPPLKSHYPGGQDPYREPLA